MYTISVIIPVYNAEKYLKKAIDSVLSQTLARIELVCITLSLKSALLMS